MIVATKLRPNDPEDRRRSVIMTGVVTNFGKEGTTRDGAPKFQFTIRYVKAIAKREDKEMHVLVVGFTDVMDIAKTLEIGDVVMICGYWQQREFVDRRGINRVYNECRADFILPLKAIAKTLCPDYKGHNMKSLDERRLMGADYETMEEPEDDE